MLPPVAPPPKLTLTPTDMSRMDANRALQPLTASAAGKENIPQESPRVLDLSMHSTKNIVPQKKRKIDAEYFESDRSSDDIRCDSPQDLTLRSCKRMRTASPLSTSSPMSRLQTSSPASSVSPMSRVRSDSIGSQISPICKPRVDNAPYTTHRTMTPPLAHAVPSSQPNTHTPDMVNSLFASAIKIWYDEDDPNGPGRPVGEGHIQGMKHESAKAVSQSAGAQPTFVKPEGTAHSIAATSSDSGSHFTSSFAATSPVIDKRNANQSYMKLKAMLRKKYTNSLNVDPVSSKVELPEESVPVPLPVHTSMPLQVSQSMPHPQQMPEPISMVPRKVKEEFVNPDMLVIDNGDGERLYQCTICLKSFTFSTNLTRHQRNIHGKPHRRRTKEMLMKEKSFNGSFSNTSMDNSGHESYTEAGGMPGMSRSENDKENRLNISAPELTDVNRKRDRHRSQSSDRGSVNLNDSISGEIQDSKGHMEHNVHFNPYGQNAPARSASVEPYSHHRFPPGSQFIPGDPTRGIPPPVPPQFLHHFQPIPPHLQAAFDRSSPSALDQLAHMANGLPRMVFPNPMMPFPFMPPPPPMMQHLPQHEPKLQHVAKKEDQPEKAPSSDKAPIDDDLDGDSKLVIDLDDKEEGGEKPDSSDIEVADDRNKHKTVDTGVSEAAPPREKSVEQDLVCRERIPVSVEGGMKPCFPHPLMMPGMFPFPPPHPMMPLPYPEELMRQHFARLAEVPSETKFQIILPPAGSKMSEAQQATGDRQNMPAQSPCIPKSSDAAVDAEVAKHLTTANPDSRQVKPEDPNTPLIQELMRELSGPTRSSTPSSTRSSTPIHVDANPKFTSTPEPVSENFRCSQCEVTCATPSELSHHFYVAHRIAVKREATENQTIYQDENVAPVQPLKVENPQGSAGGLEALSTAAVAVSGEQADQELHHCKMCGKTFVSFPSLRKHIKKHLKQQLQQQQDENAGGSYPCGICGQTFSQPMFLNKHIRHAHPKLKTGSDIQLDQPREADTAETSLIADRVAAIPSQPGGGLQRAPSFSHIKEALSAKVTQNKDQVNDLKRRYPSGDENLSPLRFNEHRRPASSDDNRYQSNVENQVLAERKLAFGEGRRPSSTGPSDLTNSPKMERPKDRFGQKWKSPRNSPRNTPCQSPRRSPRLDRSRELAQSKEKTIPFNLNEFIMRRVVQEVNNPQSMVPDLSNRIVARQLDIGGNSQPREMSNSHLRRNSLDTSDTEYPRHSDGMKYICGLCGASFTFQTNLTRHQRKLHGKPHVRKYSTSPASTTTSPTAQPLVPPT